MDLSPGRSVKEARIRFASLLASFVVALAVVRLASSPRNREEA
jgi:hypothetical protein